MQHPSNTPAQALPNGGFAAPRSTAERPVNARKRPIDEDQGSGDQAIGSDEERADRASEGESGSPAASSADGASTASAAAASASEAECQTKEGSEGTSEDCDRPGLVPWLMSVGAGMLAVASSMSKGGDDQGDATPAAPSGGFDGVTIKGPVTTNDETPTLTGKAPSNSVIDLYEGQTKLGNVTADKDGNWTFTPTRELGEGDHTLTAKVKDEAGNEGSSSAKVNIDTDPPVVTINAPGSTNDKTPTLTGKAPPNSVIDLYEDETNLGNAKADEDGNWTFTPTQGLGEGDHRLTAKVKDEAGNEGVARATVNIDTDPPEVTINTPGSTNDKTPTLTGKAPPNSVIDLYGDETNLGNAKADEDGNWTFTPTQELGEGDHRLTAKVKDAAGNKGSSSATVTIDTAAPAVTISAPALTNDSTPTAMGTAPVGSVVDIYEGSTKLGSVTADQAGNWSFTLPTALIDGLYTLIVKVKDAAGNEGSSSATMTIDTAAPAVTISAPALTNDSTDRDGHRACRERGGYL